MQIIPAIDLLGGSVVRLYQGDYQSVTTYGNDPSAVALQFVEHGAQRIHIVDLDAARGNQSKNRKALIRIRKSVSVLLEVGGGVRTDDDVERLMDVGVDRIVVGTVFAQRSDLVGGWTAHYGNIFIAGIDADEGNVKIAGWEDDARLLDVDLAKRAKDVGVCGIIYTSIQRDGTLQGPDIARSNAIAAVSGLPVIVSGGVGSLDHLRQLVAQAHPGIRGVITGKALYEETLDLRQALAEIPQDVEQW